MSLLIKNWQMADWKELLKWAKIGANNAMIGEFTEVEEVPPHGRLIDADAMMGVIRAHDYPLRAHFNSTDNGMFTIGIQQAVDEAPTVIPAEEAK